MSSSNVTLGHLVNIEWLVADVTAVGSLDRAQRAVWEVILAKRVFGQWSLPILRGLFEVT